MPYLLSQIWHCLILENVILGSLSYAIFADADMALSHPRECDSREFVLCHIMEDVDYVVVILQALDKGVDVLLLLG